MGIPPWTVNDKTHWGLKLCLWAHNLTLNRYPRLKDKPIPIFFKKTFDKQILKIDMTKSVLLQLAILVPSANFTTGKS